MKVKAGDLREALQLLYYATDAFGSKYFGKYFSLESADGKLRLLASSSDAIAQVEIKDVSGDEQGRAITSAKLFKLLQLIPPTSEVQITFGENDVIISDGKSTWFIPQMQMDELPTPELTEEEMIDQISLETNWASFRSFLTNVAPYTEGKFTLQPPVYFEICPDEGMCYCVGFSGKEALIDKIPVESTNEIKLMLPYKLLKPLTKVTPLRLEVFPSGVRFVGHNWWFLVPLLSVESADHRLFRRLYEKVTDKTIKCRVEVERKALILLLQRLKTVADISGAIKLAGGGVEAQVKPQNGELLFTTQAVGGGILSHEILPVRELDWDENITDPIRINTLSLQHAVDVFDKSPILQLAFTHTDGQWNIGRVTSEAQPLREAYFALLVGG